MTFFQTANCFDDETVMRQLRYTGMLETVRIRQAGYNVRMPYEEFVHVYRILLPNGLQRYAYYIIFRTSLYESLIVACFICSGRKDIVEFLRSLRLNPANYQLGNSKIFFRESEKIKLDYILHQQIMTNIIKIQRWYRVVLERRQFLRIQEAVVRIQVLLLDCKIVPYYCNCNEFLFLKKTVLCTHVPCSTVCRKPPNSKSCCHVHSKDLERLP